MDEDFAVESLGGDIMLLGNSSWRIRRVQAGRVIVEDAHGAAPNIPFWRGEAPARTAELSAHVAQVREKVGELTRGIAPGTDLRSTAAALEAVEWLKKECGLDRAGAEQVVEHIVAGRAVLGAVPTQTTVIAERFFDESGGMQLVIHAPFGGRINKAWGLALRKRFCRSFNLELQAAATDDGMNISLAEQHSFPLADVFRFLASGFGGRGAGTGGAGFADFYGAVEMGRVSGAGAAAISGREESAAADPENASGRFAGGSFSRCRGLPGESG